MSPRTIDATFQTSTEAQTDKEIVWFVEFLKPDTVTAGTLTRLSTGKLLDVDTTTLANTNDFTASDCTVDLGGSGGRLRILFGVDDIRRPGVVTYDAGLSDYTGVVVQANMFRNVGANTLSGHPALFVGPSTSAMYSILKYVVEPPSTTYPGGPFNEDSIIAFKGATSEERVDIGVAANLSQHVQHPIILSYGADGAEIHGYVFPASAGKLTRDATKDANADPGSGLKFGFNVYWEDTAGTPGNGNNYQDPVEVGRFVAYSSRIIKVLGLPPGYSTRITGGESASHGGPVFGSTAGLNKTSLIDLDGEAAPYNTIIITDEGGSDEITDSSTWNDDIWGGDCFQYTPPATTNFLNLCTHDLTITWNGKTWTGMSRDGLEIDPVGETTDIRAQRVGLTIQAVNLTQLNAVKNEFRGAQVKIWQAHHDGAAVVGTPLLVFDGNIDDALVAEERYSESGAPRGATFELQVTSLLADFDQNPGIRTNLKSHQRWYPGDTGMRTVHKVQSKRIFWGPGLPRSPAGAQ